MVETEHIAGGFARAGDALYDYTLAEGIMATASGNRVIITQSIDGLSTSPYDEVTVLGGDAAALGWGAIVEASKNEVHFSGGALYGEIIGGAAGNNYNVGGTVVASQNRVIVEAVIETGAKVGFLNTHLLSAGEAISQSVLTAGGGNASGHFGYVEPLMVGYGGQWIGNEYVLTATRRKESVGEVLASGLEGVSASGLAIAVLDGIGKSGYPLLQEMVAAFDYLETPEDFVAYAEYLARQLAPEDHQYVTDSLQLHHAFAFDTLQALLQGPGQAGAASLAQGARSTEAMARLEGPGGVDRLFLATPLAQWTRWRQAGPSFLPAKDLSRGLSLGFGLRQEGAFSAGLGAYYLRSGLDGALASVDTDVFGLNLHGRKYLAPCGGRWWAEAGLGFAHGSARQARLSLGDVNRSRFHSQLYNARAAVGLDIPAGCRLTLTPKLGLDWNVARTGAYTETGGPTALSVRPETFRSFQGVAGLEAKVQASSTVYLTAGAALRHEFADRAAVLRNSFVAAPDARFEARGFAQRRARADLSAGLGWEPSPRVAVGATYELRLAQRQTSHAAMATWALRF